MSSATLFFALRGAGYPNEIAAYPLQFHDKHRLHREPAQKLNASSDFFILAMR